MNSLYKIIFLILMPTVLVASPDYRQFDLVQPGYKFEFPRDHGAHLSYPNEWWYFTGHATAQNGATYGFEITFFRVSVRKKEYLSKSPFATQSLFLAHIAITDDQEKKFYHSDMVARDSLGTAGASEDILNVWLKNWKAHMTGNILYIDAESDFGGFNLTLENTKPVALHGLNGVSIKGPGQGNASLYMSFTRLVGKGSFNINKKNIPVAVSAWMDHEVLSSNLNPDTLGWDWFSIQLENNEELMLYQLRMQDGSISSYSSGSYIKTDGTLISLNSEDFSITVLEKWQSPTTNISYPIKWDLEIPSIATKLRVTPTIKEQELITTQSTGVTYWEGRSMVSGQQNGQEILGNAYVELVGYKDS